MERHGRRWLLEIVGFWTPDYLRRKLDTLRGTGVLLCIDERLACADPETDGLPVVWFRNRIDPGAVVRALEGLEPTPPTTTRVERLSLRDYFLDYAGRKPPGDPIHRRLAALRVGDALALRFEGELALIVGAGGPVAALSSTARDAWRPRADRVREVRVAGLEERTRAQSGPRYRPRLRVDRWLVPLAEIAW